MRISEIMSRDVRIADPNDNLQKAAKILADIDAGALPVGENDRLVGMLTDRDITIRAVAAGKAPQDCTVRDVMTSDVRYVFDDQDVEELSRSLADQKIRRVPVLNRDKRLVGIVSLGDLAAKHGGDPAENAVRSVSQPSH